MRYPAFFPAEHMELLFSGSADDVSYDNDELAISKVFGKTKYTLAAVKQPADIEGVPFGADGPTIRELLPATTKILTTNGFELDAGIGWKTVKIENVQADDSEEDEYVLAGDIWTARGTVALPDSVENKLEISLGVSLRVFVDEQEQALAPTASLDPGTYLYNETTTLACDEPDGRVWYTVDGSDPITSATRAKYDGNPIPISRSAARLYDEETGEWDDEGVPAIVLKAYTEPADKSKLRSEVVTYEYMFADIPVPQGAQLVRDGSMQIGVEAGPFYTLEVEEGSSAEIDARGNAVASAPGTYRVTAKLESDGPAYYWATNDEGGRSQNDHVIEFTINPSGPVFRTHSILLDGQIGVKFYMDLSELTDEEKESSKVTFKVSGKGAPQSECAFDADDMNPSKTYYGFTCYVNAIQMAEKITATFHCDGSEDVTDVYSVAEYVESVESDAALYENGSEKDKALLALVRALADYGHYVQPFLSATRGWTIGTDYAEMPGAATFSGGSAPELTVDDVAAAEDGVKDRAIVWNQPDDSGIDKATYSLELNTGTNIFVYFKMNSGASVTSAAVDGAPVTLEKRPDGRWRVVVPGIRAHELGQLHTVSVTTSTGATASASMSALSYVKGVFTSDTYKNDAVARFAVTSLYRYWNASIAYLKAM